VQSLHIKIPRARRVLDFGCGAAWMLEQAQKENSPFCVGVDPLLAQGAPAGPRPVALVGGDGLHLPFADGVFDVVAGHVSMPYMNTRKALAEVYRVLAPGGSVLLTFHSFHYLRLRLGKSLRSGHWKDLLFLGYMAVNGWLNHCGMAQTQVWWNRKRFETVNTPRGVCRAARAAGFFLISLECEPGKFFFALTARKAAPDGVLPAPAWASYTRLSTGL
jgi:SAM-dependent methyltransferase